MAKKTDNTTNPTAPETRAVKPAATPAPQMRAIKPTTARKTKSAGKAVKAPAAKAKRATKGGADGKPAYTRDDVALRAYFISEKRRARGLPGDEHQDWLEAERQLLAESSRRK